MKTYTLKLIVESYVNQEEETKPLIKPIPDSKKSNEIHHFKRDDSVKVDVNIKFADLLTPSKESSSMMQMALPLSFDNKQEFIAAVISGLAQFERNPTVSQIRKQKNAGFAISFGINGLKGTPDFLDEGIIELMTKRADLKLTFAKKLSAFNTEQKAKLENEVKRIPSLRLMHMAKGVAGLKSIRNGALFLMSVVILALVMPAVSTYLLVAGIGLQLGKIALTRLIYKHMSLYTDKDKVATRGNAAEFAAYTAGNNLPIYMIFKYFRNPLAFLIGAERAYLIANGLTLDAYVTPVVDINFIRQQRLQALLSQPEQPQGHSTDPVQPASAEPVLQGHSTEAAAQGHSTELVQPASVQENANEPEQTPPSPRYSP